MPQSITTALLCQALHLPSCSSPQLIIATIVELVTFKQEHRVCKQQINRLNLEMVKLRGEIEGKLEEIVRGRVQGWRKGGRGLGVGVEVKGLEEGIKDEEKGKERGKVVYDMNADTKVFEVTKQLQQPQQIQSQRQQAPLQLTAPPTRKQPPPPTKKPKKRRAQPAPNNQLTQVQQQDEPQSSSF